MWGANYSDFGIFEAGVVDSAAGQVHQSTFGPLDDHRVRHNEIQCHVDGLHWL